MLILNNNYLSLTKMIKLSNKTKHYFYLPNHILSSNHHPSSSLINSNIKYTFTRRKSMQDNIKQQQQLQKHKKSIVKQSQQKLTHSPISPLSNNNDNRSAQTKTQTSTAQSYSLQSLTQLSKGKLINIQLFPITLLLTPTILSIETFSDPMFLLGTVLVEKYSTLMLLMNANLSQQQQQDNNINKSNNNKVTQNLTIALTLLMIPTLHSLTGYYSVLTPLGMALTTLLLPLKFINDKQRYTQIQRQRMSKMMNIKVVYFFIFVMLTTVKALHYEAVYEMENKLKKFDEENMSGGSVRSDNVSVSKKIDLI